MTYHSCTSYDYIVTVLYSYVNTIHGNRYIGACQLLRRKETDLKPPSFQFYPGDWLKDPPLRSVGYAARGLWIDMLSLMHESDRRGFLQVNGKLVNAEQLARMTGGSTNEVSRHLQELESAGVFSCTADGVIYNRRMVRDEKARQANREYVPE